MSEAGHSHLADVTHTPVHKVREAAAQQAWDRSVAGTLTRWSAGMQSSPERPLITADQGRMRGTRTRSSPRPSHEPCGRTRYGSIR